MFRCPARPPFSLRGARRPSRYYFHRVTADFVNNDARGNLVSTKVPIIVGDPGESYVLIYPEIGSALRAGNLLHTSSSSSSVVNNLGDKYTLTFFHDSQHFGHEVSSYPRLYIPRNLPRQTDSNRSSATLFLTGKMHEIVLNGTYDAQFAEYANATGRNLEHVLNQLKDM